MIAELPNDFIVTFFKTKNMSGTKKNGDIWKSNVDIKILKLKINIFRGLRAVIPSDKTQIIFNFTRDKA